MKPQVNSTHLDHDAGEPCAVCDAGHLAGLVFKLYRTEPDRAVYVADHEQPFKLQIVVRDRTGWSSTPSFCRPK